MKYLILQNPGHNRVYYEQSEKLALAELNIASNLFEEKPISLGSVQLAGVRYLEIESEKDLSESDIRLISNLSFVLQYTGRRESVLFRFNGN